MSTQIIPRCAITIRAATMSDLPFIDALQKQNTNGLGWMPTKQLEGKIAAGYVLVAEQRVELAQRVDSSEETVENLSLLSPVNSLLSPAQPAGYCIAQDRYFKRDDVGIVYQLCVAPGKRRSLIGAMLIKEVFERAAYGCRLFCCWCAQDIEANHFWESIGFIPLAFRTGAIGKKKSPTAGPRTHIFWQRRIREGDVTTPYWFPAKTDGGMLRADRLVLPIPPGVHWKDVQAVVLPKEERGLGILPEHSSGATLALPKAAGRRKRADRRSSGETPKPHQVGIVVGGRIKYIDRPGYVAPEVASVPMTALAVKKTKPKRTATRIDPKYLAAARELRDRYLEQFNSGLVLPQGKYEVSRAIESASGKPKQMPLLEAA